MPGTDLAPEHRSDLVRTLTLAGWLLLGGPIAFVVFQLDRVRNVTDQPFASVWDQRIEVLSFLMLPPNLAVLAPVVAVAAVATWLSGPEPEVWLTTLLRFVAGLAIVFGVIGIVSIVSIMFRDEAGPVDIEAMLLRLGGVMFATGLALVCRAADRLGTRRSDSR